MDLPPRSSLDHRLASLAAAAVPPGTRLDARPDPADLGRRLELSLARMSWEVRLGVLGALALFEWSPLLRHGRRFSRLPPEVAHRWLERWAEHRRALPRLVARMLLTFTKSYHLARPEVQVKVGADPRRLEEVPTPTPQVWPADRVIEALDGDTRLSAEVVVVGSGAGGAVVAAELAEQGVDVVLLEAGLRQVTAELGRDPGRSLREAYVEAGATVAFGVPPIPLPLGRTVGGSTTINSGTCFRVPGRILDDWENRGLPVDRAGLSRAYARVEERISVTELTPELLGGSSEVIALGSAALGLRAGPLHRNIRGCQRSAVCAFGCPTEAKQSMDVTYVPRALTHGARLVCGVRATRVLRSGGRASGVEARDRQGRRLVVAAEAVVSACGTIHGVPLLAASGVRSRHLGRHLTLHPATKVVAIMDHEVDGWLDTPQGYSIDHYGDEGLMFEGAFVPPELAGVALPFVGPTFTEVMEDYRRMAMFGLFVADRPSGRVRRGLGGRPFITYRLHREDRALLQKGLGVLAEVFFAAGAERIYLPVAGRELQPDLDAARHALAQPLDPMDLELVAFHPLGTARMAANSRDGVVDPEGRCWSLPGLWIADGSVFPGALGVNPQLTIMAWATRTASHVAASL